MVAVDTSTLIALIQGAHGGDIDALRVALPGGDVSLPPVVLTEVLSEPTLPAEHRAVFHELPVLELTEGFWLRAAAIRARLLARRLRARLPDTLIAQSCIDHGVPLITRDRDFRHFAKHCGLKLA
jgi:predicted nucleic acid-binding protein